MRILIVNKFLYPNGGSETYIFKIGQQLQKMGHEIQYFGMEHENRIVGNRVESYTRNMNLKDMKLNKIIYLICTGRKEVVIEYSKRGSNGQMIK